MHIINLNSIIKYNRLRNKYSYEHGFKIGLLVCLRYYLDWWHSLQPGRTPISDRVPWVVYSAHQFLDTAIKATDRIFEYGSGGSTLFFLDKGCEVVTVEDNEGWLNAVRKQIRPYAKWVGMFVPSTPFSQLEVDGCLFASSFPGYEGKCFKKYILTLSLYPDDYFNVIFVDGRARADALRIGKSKLKRSGMLVLDNAERPRYAKAINELLAAGWLEKRFAGPGPYVDYEFWDTRIYTPPVI